MWVRVTPGDASGLAKLVESMFVISVAQEIRFESRATFERVLVILALFHELTDFVLAKVPAALEILELRNHLLHEVAGGRERERGREGESGREGREGERGRREKGERGGGERGRERQ